MSIDEISQKKNTSEMFLGVVEGYHPPALVHRLRNPTDEYFDASIENNSDNHDDISRSLSTASYSTAPEKIAAGSSTRSISYSASSAQSYNGTVVTGLRSSPSANGGHKILLKILSGNRTHRYIISVAVCTRIAILHEARAYCANIAHSAAIFGDLATKGWHLALILVRMNVSNVDLPVYSLDDLAYLTKIVGRTDIPMFTFRIIRDVKSAASKGPSLAH